MILEGSLVRLRPIEASDAHAAYPMLLDQKVLEWLLWDGPKSEEELLSTYKQWENDGGKIDDCSFAIESIDRAGIIGSIALRFPEHKEQADIGYWLGAQFWNNGYMTDALQLICRFGFEHLGITRIYAPIFKGNIRSRRVLEKNGFCLDGTLRSHLLKNKQWRDVWFMSLIRSDWYKHRE
jgi:ribosomal-protein-alanine N-acetyltransferase